MKRPRETSFVNVFQRVESIVRKTKHMGMPMTEEEHERWHNGNQGITPEQHRALMKKMGISKEEDEEWHKNNIPKGLSGSVQKPVNPFAIGGGFLDYCIRQGWLIQEGKGGKSKYYITKVGQVEIKKFGIKT